MKKRLLAIDFWTKGVRLHLLPVRKQLDSSEYEIILIHFAGLVGHKNEKSEESVEGIPCYDFRRFGRWSLKNIIRSVNPSGIILLNYNDLLSRAVMKLGKKAEIPVFLIQHGSFLAHVGSTEIRNTVRGRYGLPQYFKKVKQYIYYLLYYLHASLTLDRWYLFRSEIYRMLLGAFTDPVRFVYYPPKSSAYPSRSFVYGERDKQFLTGIGYPAETVRITGGVIFENTTDLVEAGTTAPGMKAWLHEKGLDENQKTALYLPSNLVEWGTPGWTSDIFKGILLDVYESVSSNGMNLIVKLHPAADESLYDDLKRRKNVFIVKDYDLVELISHCHAILTEWTNAIYPAIILRKPIIFLQFIKNACYGFDFVKQGIGIVCHDKTGLSSMLNKDISHKIDEAAYRKFLDNYCSIGPQKASKLISQEISRVLSIG